MKKTPKILPHLYKSKGTPIFRDTTALPFAKGGPLVEEPVNPVKPTNPVKPGNPVNPVNPISWNRAQLSPERIAAIKELHANIAHGSLYNVNDLLFYDLNKEAIDQADSFMPFMDPSYPESHRHLLDSATMDIKRRMAKQGWALDTKTGTYLKIPDEVLDLITRPEPEPLEKLEPLRPELISRNIPKELSLPPQPEVLQYQMPGYMKSYNFPTVGRYTPLAAKAVQKVTGYDRNFMEGYYDEEGNYVPGELENAREQNRVPQFQGASSLKDIFAQRAYQQALENSKSFAQGGTIHFERSEYGSDAREHYDNGGPIYTYSKRPGSYYQRAADGSWMINNSSTGGQYVPINDPTGQRTALLNKNAVVYNPPAQGLPTPTPLRLTNATPQLNQKIYPGNPANFSETTQGVAAKTVPQSAEQRANVEGARKDIAQRKSNLEKVLITQGKTPEQAASIVGSYGSDWTTLEADNARALDTMARRAETIQSGNTPDKMSTFTPRAEQPWNDKLQDIVFNPFTAAGYALRKQEIPDYLQEKADNGTLGYWANGQFVEGRNALDTAVDIGTPIGYAHSASNIIDRATNNKEDFWTEENAWDALNILPGIKLLKGANAAKDLSSAVTNTGLTQLRNNALDLAQRTRLTASKPQIVDSAIDAGNVLREPYYAPQRPSLLNPAIAPQNIKTLPAITSQGYPGIMPKYNVSPVEATAQPNVLAQLGIRENSEWFPGIKEFQKQVAAKDVSDLPLREAESWLYNWINHPTTQKKMYNSYQEALNSPMKVDNLSKMNVADRIRVKEAYQHNLEEAYKQVASYNPFNRLSYKPIKEQVLELPHNEHTNNTGVSYTHGVVPDNLLMPEIMNKTRNEFDTGKNYISRTISDEDKILTGTHEGAHDWAKDFSLTYLGQKDMFNKQSEPLFSPFITKWNNKLKESEVAKDKAGVKNAKKALEYLEYLKEPTELHARIMESRKYFNLTPDDVVTPEKAREMMLSVGAKKTPINFNFGNALLEDPKAAAYMFNEAWMAIPAIGGAALLNNSDNQKENK